jgi:1,4-alpha-glucan branching enzyme
VNEHIVRFNHLCDALGAGTVSESWLATVEAKDNVFPELDYRIYAT